MPVVGTTEAGPQLSAKILWKNLTDEDESQTVRDRASRAA